MTTTVGSREPPGRAAQLTPPEARHHGCHRQQRQGLAGDGEAEQPGRSVQTADAVAIDRQRRPHHEREGDAVLGVAPEDRCADDADPRHQRECETASLGVRPAPGDRVEGEQHTGGHDGGDRRQDEAERLVAVALRFGGREADGVAGHHHRRQEDLEARWRVELRRRGVDRGPVAVPDGQGESGAVPQVAVGVPPVVRQGRPEQRVAQPGDRDEHGRDDGRRPRVEPR